MRVPMSLDHTFSQIIVTGNAFCNKHKIKLPKWSIFNVSVLINEHDHPIFISKLKFDIMNIQWTKFDRKSIVTF